MKRLLTPTIVVVGGLVLCVASVAQDVQVWCASSAEKVFRDTAPREMPQQGVELSCAGNEYEAFQVVVTPQADVEQVRVAVAPFCSDGGAGAAAKVDVLEVRYVSVPHTEQKLWPDPLPRHLRPISVKAGENQPFWIKIYVPSWHTPGRYRASVYVNVDGEWIAQVPVTLNVLPFTLPKTPSVRTAFGIWRAGLDAQHKVSRKFQARDYLYARYYEMLLDHRVSAYDIPFGLTDLRALKYLRDPRMTSYVIPYTEDRDKFLTLRKYLASKGVFSKGFFYPIDEPFSKKSYETLERRATFVHNMTGTGKVCSPFYRGPDFDKQKDLFDYAANWLDIWCINTGYYGPKQMDKMEAAREAGGELWWYVCCGPGAPKANFFVTMEAMRHRMLFWQMYKYDIEGLLYWSTTYWNPKIIKDPWEDMATVKDINPKLYGDGSLMYPGSKVGFNIPVSSQRLECILDGLEDFEYLACLERACGREAADKMIAKLVTDMDTYSLDPDALGDVRAEIAGMLLPANVETLAE